MLVARHQAEEILIDLDTLIDLSIIPPDFPLPQDPEMRSDSCKKVQENKEKIDKYICRRSGEEVEE